jgi:O-antigen ligase
MRLLTKIMCRPVKVLATFQQAAFLAALLVYVALSGALLLEVLAADGTAMTALMVGGPIAVLAFWLPLPTLYAFSVLLFLFSGLSRAGLLPIANPLMIGFAAFTLFSLPRLWIHKRESEHQSARASRKAVVAVELFFSWIALGLVYQVIAASSRDFQWTLLAHYSNFEYIFNSTLLWHQGLYVFWLFVCYHSRVAESLEGRRETFASRPHFFGWFVVISAVLVLFFVGLQLVYQLPGLYPAATGRFVPTAPFEDIHAFGAISATFAVLCLGWSIHQRRKTGVHFLLGIAFLSLTFWSYSRTAWAAVGIGALMLAFSYSRRWGLGVLGCGAVLLATIVGFSCWFPNSEEPFVVRAYDLVRVDRLGERDAARLQIYNRAMAMIATRPIMGHGAGTSFRLSENYSEGDTLGPQFLHNTLLQVAADWGIPGVVLFTSILISVIGALRSGGGTQGTLAIVGFAVYIATQMTANSLNIYESHVFFFWTYLAVVFAFAFANAEGGGGLRAPREKSRVITSLRE